MAGPFSHSECVQVITSSVAVVPKKTVGKWQVIVDMSRPRGVSMNDNLSRELTHIALSSVEDTAHLMHYLGPNVLLAKMDISEAYRSPYTQRIAFFGRPVAGLYPYRLSAGLPSAPAILAHSVKHWNGSYASAVLSTTWT